MVRRISIAEEKWPLAKPFIISRSARTETTTIKVSISDGSYQGVGEGVPNPRYDETPDSLISQIQVVESVIEKGLDRASLQKMMPPGAARNAVDCALWDLEAKQSGENVGQLSGLGWPNDIQTVQTISILSPEDMNKEAKELAGFPIIKVKMNGELILERIAAVHQGAPDSKLLIDANESWALDILNDCAPALAELNVVMIEQPFPAGQDEGLIAYSGPLPIFADESCHVSNDLPKLLGKYNGVNIKLDKTGGLTEAIVLEQAARKAEMEIMIGCMLSTSLGIAPTMFLASNARYVDIDAPALLGRDRDHAIRIDQGKVSPLDEKLWGGG